MSDSSVDDFFSRQAHEARGPEGESPARRKRKRARRLRRIALASVLSLVVLAAGVVVAGYVAVNHYASSIHRITGITALDAAHQPVVPGAFRRGMTVLLTSSGVIPGANDVKSGLIAASILQRPYYQGYMLAYVLAADKVLGQSATMALVKPYFDTTGGNTLSTGVGIMTQANISDFIKFWTGIGLQSQ